MAERIVYWGDMDGVVLSCHLRFCLPFICYKVLLTLLWLFLLPCCPLLYHIISTSYSFMGQLIIKLLFLLFIYLHKLNSSTCTFLSHIYKIECVCVCVHPFVCMHFPSTNSFWGQTSLLYYESCYLEYHDTTAITFIWYFLSLLMTSKWCHHYLNWVFV